MAGTNEKTLLKKHYCVQEAKNASAKFQKHFLLTRRSFLCSIYVLWRNEREDIWEKLKKHLLFKNIFRMRTQATYV